MRKQPRIAAALAAFLLSTGMIAADIAVSAEPADAAVTKKKKKNRAGRSYRRAARPQAPATAANFARLRQCESRGNYSINTGNGYYGAYQFGRRTWRGLGYSGLPHQAPPHIQDEAAARLQAQRGWQPWPGCARKLRLR
jgi:hypothetical protein